MTTAFANLQAALLAALSSAPALAGGNIGTNRLRPIPTGQSTALVLRLDASEGTERVLGCIDWQTAFTVECYARGASSTTDLVAAVDTLLADTWARLAGLSFQALGADLIVDPRIDWQFDDGETPMVCAVIRLSAAHRTASSTLTPWS